MRKTEEKRKFIRLEAPVEFKYIIDGESTRKGATTKNLSCEGLRFMSDSPVGEGAGLELKLNIPGMRNPVHMAGKAVWSKKISKNNGAPFDVGVEFTKIEEDNKNTFLKYLCDLIYKQAGKTKRGA